MYFIIGFYGLMAFSVGQYGSLLGRGGKALLRKENEKKKNLR